MTSYDVAILSDLRYSRGDGASTAAEVRAPGAATSRTVLTHAPCRPLVAAPAPPRATLPDADWQEIIDLADWAVERQRQPGALPVIGRHGRPDPVKWPRDPGELLQAYPDTAEVKVRFLGGGEIGVRRLGRRP